MENEYDELSDLYDDIVAGKAEGSQEAEDETHMHEEAHEGALDLCEVEALDVVEGVALWQRRGPRLIIRRRSKGELWSAVMRILSQSLRKRRRCSPKLVPISLSLSLCLSLILNPPLA